MIDSATSYKNTIHFHAIFAVSIQYVTSLVQKLTFLKAKKLIDIMRIFITRNEIFIFRFKLFNLFPFALVQTF